MSFNADYEGIGEMLTSDFMQGEMRRRAENVAELARATAPVGPEDDPHRGLYRDSFVVSSGIQDRETRRAYGQVTNDAPYAIDLEYGTSATPKFRTLGKALDAARL